LHVGHVHPVARRRAAVDRDVDVAPAGEALGEHRRHARHIFYRGLDLAGDAIDLAQVRARHLDAHGALDARGKHVDSVADRRHPQVREPRDAHGAIELLHQLLRRHSRAPLTARLELDRRLHHLQRRGIGRRLRATDLAEHARDFGHLADQPIGLLQHLGRLAGGQSRSAVGM
jgi:hypothetical protein